MLWYKSWLETRWRFADRPRAADAARRSARVLAYPRVEQAAAAGAVARRRRRRDRPADHGDRRAVARPTAATSGRSGSARTCAQMLVAVRGAARHRRSALAGLGRRRAVHAVAAGVARPAARRPRRDRARRARRARASCPRSLLAAAVARGRPSLQRSATRWSTARCVFVAAAVLFSLATPAVDRVQRRLAAAADRLRSPPSRSASSNQFFGDLLALQPVRDHGRRDLFPRRRLAVAGTARQRGGVGGDAVRREQKPRAPGFLICARRSLRCTPN